MKTIKLLFTITLLVLFSYVTFAMDGHDKVARQSLKQTTCPVMGGKINPKYYADVEGKRIYVCCPGCIGTVKNNPQKYIAEMEAKGIKLEDAPQK